MSYKIEVAIEKIGDAISRASHFFVERRDALNDERAFRRQLTLNVAAEMFKEGDSIAVNANRLRNYVNEVAEKMF